MNTIINPTKVHQSKWGYHALSREDFKKVKLLHKHYWIAKLRVAVYERWDRKMPQNRVIRKKDKVVLEKPIPIPEPWCPKIYQDLIQKPIVPLYQQSRLPSEDPASVKPLIINFKQVETWLEEIEKAYALKS